MIIFNFIRGFFLGDLMCFLGNFNSCKPFSVSKKKIQEKLEIVFLV